LGFISRQLDRIAEPLCEPQPPKRHIELMASWERFDWVLSVLQSGPWFRETTATLTFGVDPVTASRRLRRSLRHQVGFHFLSNQQQRRFADS
jgi:hypothetical protein